MGGRAEQQQIPGTETPKNKPLSKALKEYVDKVLALMDAANLTSYEDPELGLKVVITEKKRTLKVKTPKEEIDDEGGEEEPRR